MPKSVSESNPATPVSASLKSHLPSLDGMRAFSILLVIGGHCTLWSSGYTKYSGYFGELGVSTFLVISGLLITWLMIRERDAVGSLSLKNFYIRRFLRIIPVFWFLLVTVTLLKLADFASINWPDILRAATFTHNYPLSLNHSNDYSLWLGHTWSLSLEEQFYFIWPSVFVFLSRKHAARLAVALAFSGPILRLLSYYLLPQLRGYEGFEFQTRIDILMAGCAAAFILESQEWKARIARIPVRPALAATMLFLVVADPILATQLKTHSRQYAIVNLIRPPFEAVAIAATVLILVAGKRGTAFRWANLPIAKHVGKLSYSLYIWQQLFLVVGHGPNAMSLIWRLPATYLVAFCSFNFLERPFVKLRSQFRHGISV
jgi:peptidoglycan/LPS O-acetylase OafA/YrhL